MYQKHVLEKWINQIKRDEINPEAFGLGLDKDRAIEKLRCQMNNLSSIPKKEP